MSWARLEDENLHYLMANMIPNIKRLNISGFLKQLADFGMLLLVESYNVSKLINCSLQTQYNMLFEQFDSY